MYRVFEGAERPSRRVLAPIERWLLRLCGASPTTTDLDRVRHLAADLQRHWRCSHLRHPRLQHHLPLNPQGLGPVAPDLAFNTAVSFTTNTNWQSYGGETTMSYLTQMAAWPGTTSCLLAPASP